MSGSVRKVLLTGGRGMVGRNILDHPRLGRWEVSAPSRQELDLSDARATRAFIDRFQPDLVIHAAGKVGGILANSTQPVSFLVENLDVGRNVILAAGEVGVPRLINLASSCMYPQAAPSPLKEESLLEGGLEPTSEPYALAKIVAARLCAYVMRQHPKLRYQTLVPCNLYGRHDRFDANASHLVPAALLKLHRAKQEGAPTVSIWGDGEARREFMYAGDFADAVVAFAESGPPEVDVMNIGIGNDLSVRQYYEAAARVVGWQGEFVLDRSKPVGVARKVVDTSRQQRWGWSARTPLEAGMRAAYDYFLATTNHG